MELVLPDTKRATRDRDNKLTLLADTAMPYVFFQM